MLTPKQHEVVQTAIAEVNATAINLSKQRDRMCCSGLPLATSTAAVQALDDAIEHVRLARLAIVRVR